MILFDAQDKKWSKETFKCFLSKFFARTYSPDHKKDRLVFKKFLDILLKTIKFFVDNSDFSENPFASLFEAMEQEFLVVDREKAREIASLFFNLKDDAMQQKYFLEAFGVFLKKEKIMAFISFFKVPLFSHNSRWKF